MIIEKYFGIDQKIVQQLIDATKNMNHEKTGDNGFQNTKVFLFDEYAVLKQDNMNARNVTTEDKDLRHLERLSGTLLDLQNQGVNVVPILAFQSDDGNGYIIQPRAKGAEMYDRDKVRSLDKEYILERVKFLSDVPQEHFDKFIADTIRIIDAGVLIDCWGKDNFFYDETIGFQFIDLNAHLDYEYGLSDEKAQGKEIIQFFCFLPCYFGTAPELTDEENILFKTNNKKIFEKCKAAMINNGITEEKINEIISSEKFISQKQQLEL